MKFSTFFVSASVVAMGFLSSCGGGDAGTTTTTTATAVTDSFSYAYGSFIGKNMKLGFAEQKLDIKKDEFVAALRAALLGDSLLIDSTNAERIMEEYGKKRQESEAAEKKKEEDAWFAQNVDNLAGIQKTASGLRYQVITEGKGPKPTIQDKVSVHYTGTFTSGITFDSSVERGQPATFPVGGVIPGWVEAMQLMPVGSKWKLYIPFELAYGARPPQMSGIPPFSTLVFEVELLKIEK